MREAIDNSVEELKRIDHSIFVSLKYTRTVDILVNIINRMVDCYDFLFSALLKYAYENKTITDIPTTPKEKVLLLKQIFKEQEIHDNADLYLLLKAMLKSNYSKENEYRRHVAMRAIIAGREEIININIISQYYEIIMSFFHLVDNLVKGTYVQNTGALVGVTASNSVDEENPGNPYWAKVKQMKEEADSEIARDREIRERIRLEKQQREIEKQKHYKQYQLKPKRITKRKPKIKPKRIIPKDRLRMMELRKQARKRIEKDKKKTKKR